GLVARGALARWAGGPQARGAACHGGVRWSPEGGWPCRGRTCPTVEAPWGAPPCYPLCQSHGAARPTPWGSRCAILPPDSGSRYPSALWCLVPVSKPGLGRLRPRRWCRSALLPQVGVDPSGKTAFTRPSPTRCSRVPLVHSGGWYAATQAHISAV